MITLTHLDHSFHSALTVVNFKGGFDTFKFRKGFEEDKTLTAEEKDEILDYLDDKLPKSSWAFQKVKGQIDQQEFLSTDYYANPIQRRFRGAYAPVVLKTFAGIMLAI